VKTPQAIPSHHRFRRHGWGGSWEGRSVRFASSQGCSDSARSTPLEKSVSDRWGNVLLAERR